jgi:tetratricopeptide (TPR) repeat protein
MWKTLLLLLLTSEIYSQNTLDLFFRAAAAKEYGRADSSMVLLDKAIERSNDTVLIIKKSDLLASAGRYDEAAGEALKAVTAGNFSAWLPAARFAAMSGNADKAMDYLENYLKTDRRLPDNMLKTDTFFRQLTTAERWERLWKSQPADEWMDLKAEVYYRMQRKEFDRLFDLLDHGMEKFPARDELYFFRYQVFFSTQNHKGASQNIKKAIKMSPGNASYYLAYARLSRQMKLYGDAVKQYEVYVIKNPYDILVYPEIVAACNEAGKFALAVKYAEMYLKYFEKDDQVWFRMGYAKEMLKEYKVAIDMYTQVLNLNGRYADAYFRRGMCYFEMSDWENAFNEFTLTLDLKPRTGEVFYYRGITRLNKGDKVGACRDFERAKSYEYLQATEYMMKVCKGM